MKILQVFWLMNPSYNIPKGFIWKRPMIFTYLFLEFASHWIMMLWRKCSCLSVYVISCGDTHNIFRIKSCNIHFNKSIDCLTLLVIAKINITIHKYIQQTILVYDHDLHGAALTPQKKNSTWNNMSGIMVGIIK